MEYNKAKITLLHVFGRKDFQQISSLWFMQKQNDDTVAIAVWSEETGKCVIVIGRTSKTSRIHDIYLIIPMNP